MFVIAFVIIICIKTGNFFLQDINGENSLIFVSSASRPTRTNSPPTTYDHIIDPRLQYITSLPPPPAMPYPGFSASKRLKIDHPQQAQPWMSLVRCTDRCCVPYYGNISPIPSPKISKAHGAVENVNEQTQDKVSFEYSKSVWRPW